MVVGDINPDVLESILLGYGSHHAGRVTPSSPVRKMVFGRSKSGRKYAPPTPPLATGLAISVR
jgi:hypothetical protein